MLNGRSSIASQEKALVTVLCIQLVFLPWAWGTMHAWSQITSLTLSLIGFVLALLPRDRAADSCRDASGRVRPAAGWPRVKTFPLFWLGLALLVLILVQALNPSWTYQRDARAWWMHRIPHSQLLPTSVIAPFGIYNVWRVLIVYASCWLLICGLWAGITRRRTLQLLLGVLVANGTIIAAVSIAHRMSGDPRILWIRHFKFASGFGPLVYHNHGAAFAALAGVAALGLACWLHFEAVRRFARSSPALLGVIAWFVILASVAVAGARAGLAITLSASVLALGAFAIARKHALPDTHSSRLLPLTLGAIFLAWGVFLVTQTDLREIQGKLERLRVQGAKEESYSSRVLAREQGVAMFKDKWLQGWGAGSFRYMFIPYARRNPAVDDSGTALWEFLHNDWLQTLIEFGVLGASLIGASLLWCLWRWIRWKGWRHPVAGMLAVACLQTLLHAWIDFPFQNPAVLLTWWTLVAIALRWLELDAQLNEARR